MNVSILSFNTGLFACHQIGHARGSALFSPIGKHFERRERMPKAILAENADIVCLQEVYHEDDRVFFSDALTAMYPYVQYQLPRPWPEWNGDLAVFSTFPIERALDVPYTVNPFISKVTRRWYSMYWFNVGGRHLSLCHMHPLARGLYFSMDSKTSVYYKTTQMEQVLADEHVTEDTILVGDMNIGPDKHRETYERVLARGWKDSILGSTLSGRDTITWSAQNPLTKQLFFSSHRSAYIDHVLTHQRGSWRAEGKVTLNTPVDGMFLSDHFGIFANISARI